MSTAAVAKPASIELRISYLEKSADDTHTKHVAIEITNPTLAAALSKLIVDAAKIDLGKAEDGEKIEIE